MKIKKLPSRIELLTHFDIDEHTGNLLLRKTGRSCGWQDNNGYWIVRFKGKVYKMSRIIYKMWTGRDPGNKYVDHRDGNKSNNIITNLRLVTHKENIRNQQCHRDKQGLPDPEPIDEEALQFMDLMAGNNPDF